MKHLSTPWFESLIEDCQAILTETTFNARWTVVEGYHQLGKRILEDWDKFDGDPTQRVALTLDKSRRTIQQAVQFARQFPDINSLPEGKNISWHKIANKILPQPKEKTPCAHESKYQVTICRDCNQRIYEEDETETEE